MYFAAMYAVVELFYLRLYFIKNWYYLNTPLVEDQAAACRGLPTAADKFIREDPNNPMSRIIGRYDGAGRKTVMGLNNGKNAFGDGSTAFHEVLHLFGLSDRYYKNASGNWGGSHSGYSTDVMGVYAGYPGKQTMNQTHWNSWGDYITKNGVQSGAIMNVVVDKNPATQTLRQ